MSLLTEQRRRAFDEEGYFVVPTFFTAEEVEAIRCEISALVAAYPDIPRELLQMEPAVERGEFTPANRELGVRKLFRMIKHSAFFRDLALHPRFVEISTGFLGPDVKLLQSMMLIKPPQIGSPKIWHQDNAYFRIDPCNIVGFWIALDEATVENGCMHVVPGTHKLGLQPHEQTTDLGLPLDKIETDKVVALPMQEGDALVFSSLLYHYTPDNRTTKRRRALQLHYVDARCGYLDKEPDARRMAPELIIAGRSHRDGV